MSSLPGLTELERAVMAGQFAQLSIVFRSVGLYERANLFSEAAYQMLRGNAWCPFEDGRGFPYEAVQEAHVWQQMS